MNTVWVTGATGMLATDLIAELVDEFDVFTTDRSDCDVTKPEEVKAAYRDFKADVIINAAAFTKVDACETEEEASYAANGLAPKYLAEVAKDHDALLVHVSTDYVFDGTGSKPYREDDQVNPQSAYGKHKLAGEMNVRAVNPRHLIVRTSALYGLLGHSFPATVIRFMQKNKPMKIVTDQTTAPTFTPDLANGIKRLIQAKATGTVNCVNSGETTWYDFARAICEECGFDTSLIGTTTTEAYGAPAPRPAYSVLDLERYQSLTNHHMRPWRQALAEFCRDALADQ